MWYINLFYKENQNLEVLEAPKVLNVPANKKSFLKNWKLRGSRGSRGFKGSG